MSKGCACFVFILGVALSITLGVFEVLYKIPMYDSSASIQYKIAAGMGSVLPYFLKTFEWLILVLTWICLFGVFYLEFNKINAWKIMTFTWAFAWSVVELRNLFAGLRPVFLSGILGALNCDCSFGTPSFYSGFLVIVWSLFYKEVMADREFFKVDNKLF